MVLIPKYRHIPEQYVRTKADRRAIDEGNDFDIERGLKVVNFIETYIVPTKGFGADERVKLLPWQRDEFFIPLYSWIKPNGYRLKTEAFLGLPRQNGKSLICSCCVLNALVNDNEPGADILLFGSTIEQTATVFKEVHNSAQCSPRLLDCLVLRESTYEIFYPAKNGRIKGCSTEKAGKRGKPPHLVVNDEYCFYQDYTASNSVQGGSVSRNQSLTIYASTSGTDRSTPAFAKWQYARAVQDSLIDDPTFFGLIYDSKPDEPLTLETMLKCNPTARHSETIRGNLASKIEKANRSKIEEIIVRQDHLNQWTTSVNQFLNLDAWAACTVQQWPDLGGLDAYIGVDLSTTTDLTSVVAVIPHEGRSYVEHHSFCCRVGVERTESQNLGKYSVFEADKVLTVHDGNCIDFEDVRQHLRDLCGKYNVRVIAFDPSHNASDTMLMLAAEGLPVEQFRGGSINFNQPMRRLNEYVLDGKLAHKGDSLINWEAQNLESKKDSFDRLAPHKPTDAAKIDVFVALLMSLAKSLEGAAVPAMTAEIEWW